MNTHRKLTPKDKERFEELYLTGMTMKSIAKDLGVTERSVYRLKNTSKQRLINSHKRTKAKLFKRDLERVKDLFEKSLSIRVCAKELGVASNTVTKFFDDHGYDFRKFGTKKALSYRIKGSDRVFKKKEEALEAEGLRKSKSLRYDWELFRDLFEKKVKTGRGMFEWVDCDGDSNER